MSENIIGIFSRKKAKLEDEDESGLDLEEIAKQNAAKADKLAKERQRHNHRIKREYGLKPKK